MAVDTQEKRRSLISWARPWMPRLPLPDSEINEGDRYQFAWLYRFPDDIAAIGPFQRCTGLVVADNETSIIFLSASTALCVTRADRELTFSGPCTGLKLS